MNDNSYNFYQKCHSIQCFSVYFIHHKIMNITQLETLNLYEYSKKNINKKFN